MKQANEGAEVQISKLRIGNQAQPSGTTLSDYRVHLGSFGLGLGFMTGKVVGA